jgi:iron(III) transport system ATP-binding protein
MTAPGLSVEGVTKSFGTVAVLHGVDLVVPAGRITAVLGRSGCGKSTLLRLVAGFDRPDAGTIALHDRTVVSGATVEPPERRGVGYLTQEGSLFPHLRVADNIVFGLPRARRRRGDRVAELLAMVDLDDSYARRYPHELSGGQQQRVALARALAPGPGIVLLDEPFSSLDAELRAATRETLKAALRQARTTALLVTHDQAEALSMADQVAVMRDGVIAQTGTPTELYRSPADPEIASYVGDAVLLDGRIERGVVTCALGRLPLLAGTNGHTGDGRVLVRPEQLVIASRDAAAGVPARVLTSTFYGHHASVQIELAGSADRLTARTSSHQPFADGAEIRVTVDGAVTAYRR